MRGEEASFESDRLTVTQALELLRRSEQAPVPVGVRWRVGQCHGLEALLGLRGQDQLLDRIAGCRVDGPGGLELPGKEQPVEAAEDPVRVACLTAHAPQESERTVEHLDRGNADARGVAEGKLVLGEALVIARAQAPDQIEAFTAPARQQVRVAEKGDRK